MSSANMGSDATVFPYDVRCRFSERPFWTTKKFTYGYYINASATTIRWSECTVLTA